VRSIFFAAASTLCVITALLALPPVGENDSKLSPVAAGDRAAIAANSSATASVSPRLVVTPDAGLALADDDSPEAEFSNEIEIEVLGHALVNGIDDIASAEMLTESTTTTTTTVPETTTTTAPETTTTTTAAPETTTTTTVVPAADGDRGVIISPNGIVLPIIGPGAEGGWRAQTPCGNEVTMRDGERIVSVDFVIDPGHGGSESGAVGPNGATEKALNLRIAEITEWYLEEAGYSVLLTRRSDYRIPLRSRAEIANALMPDAFISIHHNGGATRRQDTPGTEMFVDAGNPESRRLGGILFDELVDRLDNYEAEWVGTWRNGVSARLNSDGADLYGIHRYTPGVVSVITEAGYLSNESEEALFVDNDVQWAHGRAIADGLIRWKTTSDEGRGYLEDFVDDSSSGTGGFTGCTDPEL